MLKNFLKEYTEDRIETFSFVMLTIFTFGLYSIYWLGKINKNYRKQTKHLLVSEGLIIAFGIFSFIEGASISLALGYGLEGDLGGLQMWDTFSYVGFWGYMIVNVVIAFHIKNSILHMYIKQKIKFNHHPIYNFNIFFTLIFGVMYVCYKFNAIHTYHKIK
jgi:hypothetical protein